MIYQSKKLKRLLAFGWILLFPSRPRPFMQRQVTLTSQVIRILIIIFLALVLKKFPQMNIKY